MIKGSCILATSFCVAKSCLQYLSNIKGGLMKKKFDLKIVILMLGIIILSLGITALVVINSISSTNVIPSDAVLNGENISDVIRNAYILSTDNNTIKYYYNGKIYEYKGKLDKQCSKIVDLIFDGKKIVGIISKENYIIGKVEYNEKDMLTYVDGKAYSIDDNLAVYQVNKDTVKQQLPEIINSKKCSVYLSNGKICALVENQDSSDSSNTNVRVIIRNNDSIYFDNLWIYGENLRVNDKETKKKSINIKSIMKDRTSIKISANFISYGTTADETPQKKYEGDFYIKKYKKGYILINELNIEDYLCYVLPSEMPVTFSLEALKAQAICARTFAYAQIKNGTYEKYGADLDDSTSFQVYNALGRHKNTDKAVKETEGIVVCSDEKLATCYYFSTSPGKTEDMEVWQGKTPEYIRKCKSKDNNSPYYRWKADLQFNNYYDKENGKLKKIVIKKVSDSGYVLKLIAKFENKTKILNKENEIRAFLGKYISIVTLNNGEKVRDMSMIPSACFSIKSMNEKECVIEGGGFGHGIGFSQYGACKLAEQGKDYEEIINYYYKNIELKRY